jgi:hypothetical protein
LAIPVGAGNPFFSSVDGVLFNKSQTTLIQYPNYRCVGTYTTPNSVTSIGSGALLAACMTNLVIGNSVTSIGDGAIQGGSLRSVTIGNSVTSMGSSPFANCPSLLAITVDPSNPAYSSLDGVLFNKSRTTLVAYPGGKAGSYTIPNSVTNIGPNAFYYRLALTSIIMGDSVTSIGTNAFYLCRNLTNVTMGNGVRSIGDQAFWDCSGLTSVMMGNSVTSIGDEAFGQCTRLTSVMMGDGVTSIGSAAFTYCTSLTNITMGNGVRSIGGSAFVHCERLTSVTMGDSVTSLGDWAFASCTNLTNVRVGNGVTSIGSYTFQNCTSLTNVIIGSSVTDIGASAFLNCHSLASVYFRGNAPTARGAVFSGATGTVYYLPGTTGWDVTYGGLPTALWFLPTPQVLNHGSSFGVKSNQFGFIISWATNISVVVEACTNLANPAWFPVRTNTLAGGASYFSDPQWTNYPTRLYRLRSP